MATPVPDVTHNTSGSCFNVSVFSEGIWRAKNNEDNIFQHSLVRFHVQLIAFVALTNAFHFVLKRFYFARITSEFLTGIVLGPSILGKYNADAFNVLFPRLPDQVLASLSKVGYILFTFLAAVRTDPNLIRKTGKKALIIGMSLQIMSMAMTQTLAVRYENEDQLSGSAKSGKKAFLSNYFNSIVTSQVIGVSYLLLQLKITNSRLGHLALASTLVGELARIVYLTLAGYQGVIQSTTKEIGFQAILASLFFTGLIVFVLRGLMFWFIRRTPEDKPMKEVYTTVSLAMVLFLAAMGDNVGMHYLFGPMIFGLAVPSGSPLATLLVAKFETIVSGLLSPLLVTFCVSKFNLWHFLKDLKGLLAFKISLIGYALKLMFTFITILSCKMPLIEAAALALIVNVKGLFEMGILLSFGNLEARDTESTSGVFLIFLLSAFLPPLVKLLYDPAKQYIGYRKKCLEHAPKDAELHILACLHRQEDAMSAINLLQHCNPTKESPLSIYGLCLEELISSATPLLIDHQLGQKTSSEGSCSQSIIDIFNYFKSELDKLAQVHLFTAISPGKQMHEDICWLAFDKGASLIILPFHKRWNSSGKVLSSNSETRNLNISVLERAPCSVGILIDRRRTRGLSSVFVSSAIYRVAVLFVGGPDDREAMAFALRMAGSSKVMLTVVHLVTPNDRIHHEWEKMLDNESLRGMKLEMSRHTNINYMDERVRDGSDTGAVIQSLGESYNLIIVGRRHDSEPDAISGLSEWTELPELGPIGDLLASVYVSQVSVLIVQQQIMKASHSWTLN